MRTLHFALLFFILGLATGVAAFTLPDSPTGSLIDVTFLIAVAAFLVCSLQVMTRRMMREFREESSYIHDAPDAAPSPMTHGANDRRNANVRSHQHARQTTPYNQE